MKNKYFSIFKIAIICKLVWTDFWMTFVLQGAFFYFPWALNEYGGPSQAMVQIISYSSKANVVIELVLKVLIVLSGLKLLADFLRKNQLGAE